MKENKTVLYGHLLAWIVNRVKSKVKMCYFKNMFDCVIYLFIYRNDELISPVSKFSSADN